ncbi:MgtC/SapB family protein [Paenibacillus sp. LHD-117]|uniref:MgtC/SapB family protein n=1 Tax=Paenibacillus sp. LHD-117 TaxID=3071412 RepID=UPI0027DEE399|nr:MgtC/SapB family protein [Paenibacillus sp. LHD-117]MDQ6422300.1 MgtC/SapB family protein [Paenibacillus sp. LHD-117]
MDLLFNPEVWRISQFELTIRILLALVLGGMIGFERELGGHSAGFRTHILVCMGSAVIVLLSMYGFAAFASEPNVRLDPARLAAQVISGIGFIGAGTIMRNGLNVSGLTTAASLWVSAAIGLSAGAGFYYCAVISTVLVVISLFALNKVEKLFSRTKKVRELLIKMDHRSSGLGFVLTHLNRSGLQINKLSVDNDGESPSPANERYLIIRIQVKLKKVSKYEQIIASLIEMEGVVGLETVDLMA